VGVESRPFLLWDQAGDCTVFMRKKWARVMVLIFADLTGYTAVRASLRLVNDERQVEERRHFASRERLFHSLLLNFIHFYSKLFFLIYGIHEVSKDWLGSLCVIRWKGVLMCHEELLGSAHFCYIYHRAH
jgi:hypothetical protein